jgi:hypothetical protein
MGPVRSATAGRRTIRCTPDVTDQLHANVVRMTVGSMDWCASVDASVRRILERSYSPPGACPDADLERFQQAHEVRLPLAYLRFLRGVGCDSGDFLRGSDLHVHQLDELQDGARALLDDDDGPSLPHEAFVFCGHQGYQFLFFSLNGDPDPEVLYYLGGERTFRVVAASFSDWLALTVRDEFPDVDVVG